MFLATKHEHMSGLLDAYSTQDAKALDFLRSMTMKSSRLVRYSCPTAMVNNIIRKQLVS